MPSTPSSPFARFAGLSAILSAPIAIASLLCIFSAFRWDFAVAFDPARAIAFRPDPAPLLRLGWILDILGYYLPLVPAMLYLADRQRPGADPSAGLPARLASWAGLGHVLTGTLGAAILAGATGPLFASHAAAEAAGDAAGKALAAGQFALVNAVVLEGIWNLLSMFLGSAWWLFTGWSFRSRNKAFSAFFLLLGASALADVLGTAAGLPALAGLGLNIYLWLGPLGAAWLGLILRRGKE